MTPSHKCFEIDILITMLPWSGEKMKMFWMSDFLTIRSFSYSPTPTHDLCITTLVRPFHLHWIGTLISLFNVLYWSNQLPIKFVNNCYSKAVAQKWSDLPQHTASPTISSLVLRCILAFDLWWNQHPSSTQTHFHFSLAPVCYTAECRSSSIKVSVTVMPC